MLEATTKTVDHPLFRLDGERPKGNRPTQQQAANAISNTKQQQQKHAGLASTVHHAHPRPLFLAPSVSTTTSTCWLRVRHVRIPLPLPLCPAVPVIAAILPSDAPKRRDDKLQPVSNGRHDVGCQPSNPDGSIAREPAPVHTAKPARNGSQAEDEIQQVLPEAKTQFSARQIALPHRGAPSVPLN